MWRYLTETLLQPLSKLSDWIPSIQVPVPISLFGIDRLLYNAELANFVTDNVKPQLIKGELTE